MTAPSSVVVVARKGPGLFDASAPGMALLNLPVRIDPEGVEWIEADGFGGWLGYGRARAVRDLADRLIATEILSDSDVCRTVRQTSRRGGRPTDELWFNRRASLIVAAKAETKRSTEVLHWMVDVILAVRDAMFPSVPAERLRVAEAKVARLAGAVADRSAAVDAGVLGRRGAEALINAPIRDMARRITGESTGKAYRREVGRQHRDVRGELGGFDLGWDLLPVERRGEVVGRLAFRRQRLGRDLRSRRGEQLPLPLH